MVDIQEIVANLKYTSGFWVLALPLILMVIDFITGAINAWVKKEFKTCKMRQGLVKKVGEFMTIVLGILFVYAISLPEYVLNLISLYVVLMELLSICENLGKLGVPIPKFIKHGLECLNEKIQNGGDDSDDI